MDKQALNKLNDKLLDWAGFQFLLSASENPHYWVDPNGRATDKAPNFPNDISACFKWLIPEYLKHTNLPHKEAIKELFCAWVEEEVFYHSPSEALSLVFEKLIDQEAKQ